ncbi:1-deoxyxylulose-5-phosphate synthase YajO [Candidatus Entotheonellaceae bacterium PAL068K]
MEYRTLGKTGLRVSALGFGCGNVGGLMIRGTLRARERAVARAVELGINYFDTASTYGNGQSEIHLGQVLNTLKPEVYVGTKFRLFQADMTDIAAAIRRSLEASLQRLGLECVDLFQFHNPIGTQRRADAHVVSVEDVLESVVPTLRNLQQQGKTRFYGLTGLGETAALHRVVDAGVLDTVQVCYNLLNPSAGHTVPAGFPLQDFSRLLERAHAQQMGVINIRVLAAGALSGSEARHPIAAPTVAPIASGPDYATDVQRARMLNALVQDGYASNLVEASLRFAVSSPAVSTILLGYSNLEHLERAADDISRGPLAPAALERLPALWQQFLPNA